jgi:hypothetical protein
VPPRRGWVSSRASDGAGTPAGSRCSATRCTFPMTDPRSRNRSWPGTGSRSGRTFGRRICWMLSTPSSS